MTQLRCLLVDDDAISAVFVGDWLAARGWEVRHAETLAGADAALAEGEFELWLVDRRLPDGDGLAWLGRRLAGCCQSTPRCLLASGERIAADALPPGVGSLRKPLDTEWLSAWLESQPANAATMDAVEQSSTSLLEDERALTRFGGNRAALHSLRRMLLAELRDSVSWRASLAQSPTPAAALDALHRLRAGCTLTGCVRLGAVAEELESALRAGAPARPDSLQALDEALRATMLALGAQ